ncbi:unnamed protein product [marine sediment metagenome]|uniref:Uncharacterized protein n=1 Tax=marine sediment metagenome TaxID=412755 RepID=X1M7E8_9ZZZZ
MSKKRSKDELFEAGICPDCGGKLHFEGIKKKEDLIKLGYVETEPGFYEKNTRSCRSLKDPDRVVENKAEAGEKNRTKTKWRYRNLKLAEERRSKRNLKRLGLFKSGGLQR